MGCDSAHMSHTYATHVRITHVTLGALEFDHIKSYV
nr:MAG TPA: DNA-binding response regulator [Caudoviricetes sp.]